MLFVTILGDYFVKKSSIETGYSGWKLLVVGGLLYGVSAIGWFWVYRSAKVFTVGAIHSIGIIILTIFLSLVIFKEKINLMEIVGMLLGVISLIILLKNSTF
jgi:uncharacterized membrane protein